MTGSGATTPEANSDVSRDFYQWNGLQGKGRITPEIMNAQLCSDGYPGVQEALRRIMYQNQGVLILKSGANQIEPGGTYSSCKLGSGAFITMEDGVTRRVLFSGATSLNIDSVDKCAVVDNTGVASVKVKTAVLDTDAVIAVRTASDSLMDVRNRPHGSGAFVLSKDVVNVGGKLEVSGLTQVRKVGVDAVGYRTIVLKDGDDISDAVTALGGAGTIILLPGMYTDDITISSSVSIIGTPNSMIRGTVTITAENVILDGITIDGNSSTSLTGVSITTSTTKDPHIIIRNCRIEGFFKGIVCSAVGVKILGNTITGITGTNPIAVTLDAASILLKANTIYGVIGSSDAGSSAGIWLTSNASNCIITQNTIQYLRKDNSGGYPTSRYLYGIYVVAGSNYNIISANMIKDLDQTSSNNAIITGILSYGVCMIIGNIIDTIHTSNVAAVGISIATAVATSVVGNIIVNLSGTGTTGIATAGCSETIVSANQCNGLTVQLTGTNEVTNGDNNP